MQFCVLSQKYFVSPRNFAFDCKYFSFHWETALPEELCIYLHKFCVSSTKHCISPRNFASACKNFAFPQGTLHLCLQILRSLRNFAFTCTNFASAQRTLRLCAQILRSPRNFPFARTNFASPRGTLHLRALLLYSPNNFAFVYTNFASPRGTLHLRALLLRSLLLKCCVCLQNYICIFSKNAFKYSLLSHLKWFPSAVLWAHAKETIGRDVSQVNAKDFRANAKALQYNFFSSHLMFSITMSL